MATQKGILPLSGNLGGINFYLWKGKPVARVAGGGFNGEKIKHHPDMHRVRENSSEFGDCSRVKKHFKNSLRPLMCIQKDGSLHGRMMKLFMHLRTLDTQSTRGERRVGIGIMTPEGKKLLKDFDFTPSCNVRRIAGLEGSYNSGTRTFSVQHFDVQKVKFPGEATHLALTLGLLHFDFETLAHELKSSPPFYINKDFMGTDFSLIVDSPEVSGLGMAVLGMKFYQEVNGVFYLFQSQKEVGVEVLWVD